MKNYVLLLILMTTLICVGCCEKDSDPSKCTENYLGEVSLTQNEKIVPQYKINDSLVFINEIINNSLLYTCKFQVSDYFIQSENEPDSNGNIACLGNYYKTEAYITQFNDRPTNWIRIQINKSIPFDTIFKVNGLRISISIPGDSIALFDGDYAFNSDSVFTYPHLAGPCVIRVYDTITIAGQLYHKVYLLNGFQHLYLPERIIQVLYSTSYGILSFSTNKKKVWNIKNKTILH